MCDRTAIRDPSGDTVAPPDGLEDVGTKDLCLAAVVAEVADRRGILEGLHGAQKQPAAVRVEGPQVRLRPPAELADGGTELEDVDRLLAILERESLPIGRDRDVRAEVVRRREPLDWPSSAVARIEVVPGRMRMPRRRTKAARNRAPASRR